MKQLPKEWIEQIITLLNERIVVVDAKGIVVYMDQAYCDFIERPVTQCIGYHVKDVIENTRMHVIVKTGKIELEDFHPINGSVMIANRFPIVVDDEIVGAVGTVMFPTPENLRDFKNKIQQLVTDLSYYRDKVNNELRSKYTFKDLIGNSQEFVHLKEFAETVAGNDSSVLITGESGTGKELFANAIHNSSLREQHPFLPINCSAIPEELFESELFGYSEGAFTDAKKGGKKGLFEIAHNGTIFLDEIGELPLSMQSKLLRVLQEREIQPIGAQKYISINVRIIVATNRNLLKMVENGEFREDLYYRLNVIHIDIPPLRKRKEDIKQIAYQLLRKLEHKFYRSDVMISKEVIKQLEMHHWPGNVRELENVLERAINMLKENTILLQHLPLYIRDIILEERMNIEQAEINRDNEIVYLKKMKEVIADAEKQAIQNALSHTKGNKLEAAKLLGIGKTSLYDKCHQYSIN